MPPRLTDLILFSALASVLAGCALVGPLDGKELTAIESGQKTLVLLRVTAKLQDGSEIKTFSQGFVRIFVGGFETGGILKPVTVSMFPSMEDRSSIYQFLSDESRDQGWIYFLFEPGTHYLGFIGQGQIRNLNRDHPGGLVTLPQRLQGSITLWRIDIPRSSPVIYGGTLRLRCRSDWDIWPFVRTGYCDHVDELVVENEETRAQKMARENVANLSSPQTVLLQRHDGKTIILRTPGRKRSQ